MPLCPAEKIYLHRDEGEREDFMSSFSLPRIQTSVPSASDLAQREEFNVAFENVYTRFLEKFLPASVIIDDQNNVIHFFGNYADYLNIAPGKATFNFFSLISRDISLVASTAVNRCRAERRPITYTGVSVNSEDSFRTCDLSVQPILDASGLYTGLLAILFVEQHTLPLEGRTEQYNLNTIAAQRIAELEHELQASQEDLHFTIGELESVNEELQAANEELLTTNEELQSSNAELQTANEKLNTVNARFQQKLDELTTLTNDLSNFLSSTMIGVILVDSRLHIRKFTEYIDREFQLTPRT